MKRSCKFLSVLLCLAMLLSFMPGMVFTAKATEAPDISLTGISIVENYDHYVGENWVAQLGLPENVTIGGEEKAVKWANASEYVNPDKLGYYAVPGTVEGVQAPVYFVVQVREYTNLLTVNPGFESGATANWSWSGTRLNTANITLIENGDNSVAVKLPAKEGAGSGQIGYNRSTVLGDALFDSGAGQYMISIDVWADKAATETVKVGLYAYYGSASSSSHKHTESFAGEGVAFTTEVQTVKAIVDLPFTTWNDGTADHNLNRAMFEVSGQPKNTGNLYLDNAKVLPLKFVLTDTPDMIVKGATVDLENSLDMNFYIDQAQLTEGETYTAKIVHTYADGSEDVKNITVDTANVDSTGYCYVTYQNIAAKEMGDQITVTFSDSQGNAIAVWQDSVKQYVERLMADKADDAELQTLCVDLLNYGAAAQQAFSYNLNALVNADLNGQEGTTGVTATNTATGTAQWEGTALTLESNITMELFFTKDALTEGAIATVSYTDHTGANVSKDVEVKLDAHYDLWSVKVEDLVLADTNTAVTVTIGEITATDSMASYVARSQVDNTDAIYNAILAVGTSARAYFNS